ncbi:type II toxin-antitoxin system VapC family toxin [Actinocrispum wychmicini]|uniref:Ribonuclease VapC n=1 Tax=Actinocrispum wychmicini TaxID=1213861 RepID=A0A4V2S5U9_9PSEU|nr:type II toxin-antitoxin system VapC family toxin [Actinocrispum wychmicini]TCO53540.1 putative nucleic acid-binding protein [Actinocrispum wychmicini]
MIIFDACVLIAHFRTSDAHHEDADRILLDSAETPIGASTITLAEVFTGPSRHPERLHAVQAEVRDMELQEIHLDRNSATQLAQLRVETGLKLPDCCVLLAATQVSADTVATFDDRLAKAARDRGLTVLG